MVVKRALNVLIGVLFSIIVSFSLVVIADGWYDPSLLDSKTLNIKEYV